MALCATIKLNVEEVWNAFPDVAVMGWGLPRDIDDISIEEGSNFWNYVSELEGAYAHVINGDDAVPSFLTWLEANHDKMPSWKLVTDEIEEEEREEREYEEYCEWLRLKDIWCGDDETLKEFKAFKAAKAQKEYEENLMKAIRPLQIKIKEMLHNPHNRRGRAFILSQIEWAFEEE